LNGDDINVFRNICLHLSGKTNNSLYLVTRKQINTIIPAFENFTANTNQVKAVKYFISLHISALAIRKQIANEDITEEIISLTNVLKDDLATYSKYLSLQESNIGNTLKLADEKLNFYSKTDKFPQAKKIAENFGNELKIALKNTKKAPVITNSVSSDALIKKLNIESDGVTELGGMFVVNENGNAEIHIVDIPNKQYEEAVKAHELQHFIQYSQGKLAFVDIIPFHWTYDLNDEIDAFKVQYIIYPEFFADWVEVKSVNDINDKVIGEMYPNLPAGISLGLDSTLQEVQNALKNKTKKELPQYHVKKMISAHLLENLPEIFKNGWDGLQKISVRDYLNLEYTLEGEKSKIADTGFGIKIKYAQ
jgi:hypothetical protein